MRELEGFTYEEARRDAQHDPARHEVTARRARVGLAEAAQARDTSCDDIREDLAETRDRRVRRAPARSGTCATAANAAASTRHCAPPHVISAPPPRPRRALRDARRPARRRRGRGWRRRRRRGRRAAAGLAGGGIAAATATKVAVVVCCVAATAGGGAAAVKVGARAQASCPRHREQQRRAAPTSARGIARADPSRSGSRGHRQRPGGHAGAARRGRRPRDDAQRRRATGAAGPATAAAAGDETTGGLPGAGGSASPDEPAETTARRPRPPDDDADRSRLRAGRDLDRDLHHGRAREHRLHDDARGERHDGDRLARVLAARRRPARRRRGSQPRAGATGSTRTGMPLRNAMPASGSRSPASALASRLKFTPPAAFAIFQPPRWPQPCGSATTPAIISSVTLTGTSTAPLLELRRALPPSSRP